MPAGHSFPDATGVAFALSLGPPSLLAAIFRDRAPMVQRTLLNLLRLLLLLLGTEHRWCEDPIVSVLFIIIIIRDRAPMVQRTLLNLLCLLLLLGTEHRWCTPLDSATYKYIQGSAPRATFHEHVRKSVHSCDLTIPTKKCPGTKSETKQEVGYFEFSCHILYHFCHFQVSYFNELLSEIFPDEHQNWSL